MRKVKGSMEHATTLWLSLADPTKRRVLSSAVSKLITCLKYMRKIAVAIRGRSDGDWSSSAHFQKLEVRGNKTSSLTSINKDNMILEIYEKTITT